MVMVAVSGGWGGEDEEKMRVKKYSFLVNLIKLCILKIGVCVFWRGQEK